jgi:hypothetical protein
MSYLGDTPKFSTFPSQRFSGDGSTTAFTLQQSTPSPASIIVTIDGVKQQAATYGVTGTSLEFSPGVPASGSNNIEVIFMGLTASGIPTVDQTLGVNAIMRTNAQTISENLVVGATTNAQSAGPITVADGYSVTVNGYWSVV